MKMTQKEKVFRHLKRYGKITSWEAIMDYGITRLGAVVYDLKKDGCVISSQRKTTRNRFGENVNFAEYELGEEKC